MAVDEKRMLTIPQIESDGDEMSDAFDVRLTEEPNGVVRIDPSDSDDTFPVRLADLAEVVRRLTGGPALAATPSPTPEPVRRLVIVTDADLRCSTTYVDGMLSADLAAKHISPGHYIVERWTVRTSEGPWPDTLAELTRVEEVGT